MSDKVERDDYNDRNEYKKALRASFSESASSRPRYKTSRKKKMLKKSLTVPLVIFLFTGLLFLIFWSYAIRRSQVAMKDVKGEVERQRVREEIRKEFEEENKREEVSNEDEKVILPELLPLYEQNPDLAGFLTIDGTVIDYPVMYKEGDNDYYLTHGFDGSTDVNGCLVLDKRCDKEGDNINTLIHGHNMKSGQMFGQLKNYASKDFYLTHPIIRYSTLYKTLDYEIFAVFTSEVYNEDSEDFAYYDFINIDGRYEFNEYVQNAIDNSLYDTGVRVKWGDKLITLSTCEYSKENGRLVIVARAVDL